VEERRGIVGTRIRKAREAKGLLQKHLAGRVHVEPQTISNWERSVTSPDLDMLTLIARELEQPLTYFVSEPDEVSPDPAMAAEVADIRVVVNAMAAKAGLDVGELLRAERERQREAGDPESPGEAAQAV
jgi:transcriptional regulator with XRE-family HTH domain